MKMKKLFNDLLNNPKISFKAKWLFIYLKENYNNWDLSIEKIKVNTKESKDAIRSWLKELEEQWYLKRNKYQDDKWYWRVKYILKD